MKQVASTSSCSPTRRISCEDYYEWKVDKDLIGGVVIYRCPKCLESIGMLIIFLIFIYGLKLNVKRLKMALTLDERVEIVLGDS
jgi:hypothetical protein